MNKSLIFIGILMFMISFVLFMVNINSDFDIKNNSLKNDDDVVKYYYVENSNICKSIGMKTYNETHCKT